MRQSIVDLTLDIPELSPHEPAVRFTDTEKYFDSEASIYCVLKSLDLITDPAFIAIKAADEFRDKTTEIYQLWQTDFTYLKGIGWGWMNPSTILDDYSRDMIAWKLCKTMQTGDITYKLDIALQASGCDQAHVMNKPRRYRTTGQVTSLASLLNGWVTRTRLIKLGKRCSRYVKISRGGYSDNSSVS